MHQLGQTQITNNANLQKNVYYIHKIIYKTQTNYDCTYGLTKKCNRSNNQQYKLIKNGTYQKFVRKNMKEEDKKDNY